MWKSVLKIATATILFAGVHSLLAARAVKRKTARLLGAGQRNAFYRPVYNAAALATFGALVLYGIKLPDREIYRVRRPLAAALRLAQIFFLLYLIYGVKQIGFFRFSGIANLIDWIGSRTPVAREPEAQGPILDALGKIKTTGPFSLSRHPLNFGMLPILWLMPRMTVNLAVFNAVATVYSILGSLHEEKRLVETYGQAYINYQLSEINFFVPFLPDSVKTNKKIMD